MTQEQKDYGFINRIVLSHINLWIQQHIDNKDGDLPEICHKLRSAGYASRVINGFSDDEVKVLMAIEKDSEFIPIKDKEISLVIMALEVMKQHVGSVPKELRRPSIHISDKKLLQGKGAYAMDMLKTKISNKEMYGRQKEVIDSTAEHADLWYNWMTEAILSKRFVKGK